MSSSDEMCGSARYLGRRQQILAALAILGSICAVAGAQVDVNETGLHDDAGVSGLEILAPAPPYLNAENISVWAWGETDPDLYTNVAFGAYGIYSEPNLTNTGSIGVNAVGGNATATNASTLAYIWDTTGLFTLGDADNIGNITISVLGGTAVSSSGAANVNIQFAEGVYAQGDANNAGNITITATGGTADSSAGSAYASMWQVMGVEAGGNLYNTGDITITATGGTANAGNDAFAYSSATGLFTEKDANNTGTLSVTAIGGSATTNGEYATASAAADAYGIDADWDINNGGAVTTNAIGGMATAGQNAAEADATADGLRGGGNITNIGDVIASATGGIADGDQAADAVAYTYGIFANSSLDNSGVIDVNATGGTATAGAGIANAYAYAYGVEADNGNLNNSGAVTATATGGTADANDAADASAYAYGIQANNNLDNGGTIHVDATGGTALSRSTTYRGSTSASGLAYGLYAKDGAIDNTNEITVTAQGGSALVAWIAYAQATAFGILADDGETNNTGDITVTAIGGMADGDHIGFADAFAVGLSIVGDANNAGDVTVTAIGGTGDGGPWAEAGDTQAYAMGLSVDGDVNNTGDIAVTAIGGTADRTAVAYAAGLSVDGDISNTGDIIAAAIGRIAAADDVSEAYSGASAMGIRTRRQKGSVNNSGTIIATATGGTAESHCIATSPAGASATAMAEGIASSEGVNNSGSIIATATGGTADANDYTGAYVSASGIRTYKALNNSGSLTITATGGTATCGPVPSGMASADYSEAYAEAWGLRGHDVNNVGAITVAATAGTASARDFAYAHSYAVGIQATANVSNTGELRVTATGGTATAAETSADADAYGIIVPDASAAGTDVHNSGDITVTATAQEGFTSRAYGIRMDYSRNLTNTGIIRAAADTAYELYVASGTTTLVDTYNVTLDGDPNQASIGVADGATLALNNATLTVTALSGETLWDTQYRLFATDSNGVVDGNFANAQAVNPNTTVTYDNQGTTGSADDTVALAYTPLASPMLASVEVEKQVISQAGDVVNRHMTTTLLQNILFPPSSGLLANAGSTAESLALAEAAPDKTAGVFVEPYYSRIDKDANPLGFDASLWGFSAGCERYMENTLLGLHLGYGQSDIEYTGRGYSGNSEDQDVVTGGLSALTRWDPWTLRYGLTGFYGRHDYEGLTGLALDQRETASYDSYGTAATLMAGHIFRRGSHIFLPEAGLNWLWVHRQRYTTEATDPSWDITYSAMDDHDLQAVAALRWLSSFLWHDIHVSPSASVGVRHLLTDAETSAWQSIPGAVPVLVTSEQDRTAIMLSGSLVLTKTPHAVSLAYDGDYSPDAQRHSIWLRYSWLF